MAEDIQSLLDRATDLLDANDSAAALRIIDSVLEKSPDDVDGIALKSEALVLSDRWEEAEEILQGAATRQPRNAAIILALANLIVDFHPDDTAALREAAEMATRAAAGIGRRDGDRELHGELQRAAGRALVAFGDPVRAAMLFQEARDVLGDEPELLVELAMARFEALEFADSERILRALVSQGAEDARVSHYLGLIAERAGMHEEAEAHFAHARRLDPDEFVDPVHLPREEFDEVVSHALDTLPARVTEYLSNVPILVEDLPPVNDLQGDPPLSPLSLGMFRGLPGLAKSHFDPWSQLPSSIVLFQKNIERYVGTREELIEEIETTVLHEVGHYLGWNEDDLYEHNLE